MEYHCAMRQSVGNAGLQDMGGRAIAVTHQSSSLTWLHRKSAHRLWLRDIHIYVFCSRYRSHNQRPGPAGAFELYFVETVAAAHFRDLFNPLRPSAVTAAPSSYKATVEEGDDSC
ncbi:hypothetical protein ACHAQG_001518 [Verticillium nonalfalfae]